MSLVLPTFSGFVQPAGGAVGPLSNSLAGSFDGTDDIIDCGILTAYQGASTMSMSFWFKPDSSGVGPSIGMGENFNHQYGFTSYSSSSNFVLVNQTNNTYMYGGYNPPADTNWHHYLMTFSSGTLLLYIDGSVVTFTSTVPGATALPNSSYAFHIGEGQDNYYSDGLIDEVALWTVALDSANVTAIYNSGTPTVLTSNAGNYDQSSSLTHWWRLGDDSADTSSGGGAAASGNAIDNVENVANPGTNDGTGSGATYSSTVP